jgi:protein-L-isoaspartate O-methyltransferase
MYVTVLEALDLQSGKSFLNVGSGSGYLSCLAAYLLGEEGVSHGVEISEQTCAFSRERAKAWHMKVLRQFEVGSGQPGGVIPADGISFVHANCFDLDVLSAANTLKYDRIYVGAGCPDARKEFFLSMLADNGVLVVPINEKNQMLSIRKFCGRVFSAKPISNVNFAPLLDTTVRPDEQDILGELAAHEGLTLRGDLQECIRRVQAAPSSASFIIHPLAAPVTAMAAPLASPPSSSAPSPTTGTAQVAGGGGAGLSFNVVRRVRLPPLGTFAPAGCTVPLPLQ